MCVHTNCHRVQTSSPASPDELLMKVPVMASVDYAPSVKRWFRSNTMIDSALFHKSDTWDPLTARQYKQIQSHIIE